MVWGVAGHGTDAMAFSDKPAHADTCLNPFGVRPDRAQLLIPFTDALSGNAEDSDPLTIYGADLTESPWDGLVPTIIGTPEWSDDEGGALTLVKASDQSICFASGIAEQITWPRGTIVLRFKPTAGGVQRIWRTARPIDQFDGRMIISWLGATGAVTATLFHGVGDVDNVSVSGLSVDDPHTLVLSWGEQGYYLWVDGVASGDNTTTPPGDMVAASGKTIECPEADMQHRGFAWYDWQLSPKEVAELDADPYLPFRGHASGYIETPAPQCGRMTADGGSFAITTGTSVADDADHRLGFKIIHSASADMSDASEVTTTATTPNTRVILPVTGILDDNVHWAQAQYRIGDAGTWMSFPCRRLRFRRKRASDSKTFTVALVSDRHMKPDVGTDAFNPLPAMNYMASMCGDDIYLRDEDDFVIDVGDQIMLQGASDQAEIASLYAGARELDCSTGLHHAGPYFQVLGNHEAEKGYDQVTGRQKWATAERLRYVMNPDDGEPGDGSDWVPPLDGQNRGDPPVTWDQTYRDTYVGPTDVPLENYYAFEHGDVLFVVLDIYRYSDPGQPAAAGRGFPCWVLGPTQRAWLVDTLANSTASRKFIVAHAFTGCLASVSGWYQRGTATHLDLSRLTTLQYSDYEKDPGCDDDLALGRASIAEELWLHRLAQAYGVTAIIKGHDHQYVRAIKDGVNYIALPSVSGYCMNQSAFTFPDLYGTTRQQGIDKGTDGVAAHYKTWGYVVLRFTATTCTVELRRTSCAHDVTDWALDIDAIGTDWYSEHLSDVIMPEEGGESVVLPGSDVPRHVHGVWKADAISFRDHETPPALSDPASANLYTRPADAPDGMEPHTSTTIAITQTEGEGVRVDWAPCVLDSAQLTNASAPRNQAAVETISG